MARGDVVVFNEAMENISGLLDLSDTTDFKCKLVSVIPTAADLTPDESDYTEVTPLGTEYVTGGLALTTSWTESGGVTTFNSSDASWAIDASGPTDIRAAVVYSVTAAGEDALCFVDLTTDGSTPISLAVAPVNIYWSASGVFTLASA